ncbi:MAG: hypothetical protein EAZ95_04745, partial [Bacteroidetes bacterium]
MFEQRYTKISCGGGILGVGTKKTFLFAQGDRKKTSLFAQGDRKKTSLFAQGDRKKTSLFAQGRYIKLFRQ